MLERVDRFFDMSGRGSSWSIEGRAAITTWLAMCYILAVNPSILTQAIVVEGVDLRGELITATAIAASVGCILMGLLARHPFAVAPGMGLNAYFAYSVVLGRGIAWETALGAVFLSGCVFVVLSYIGVREAMVRALPAELRAAIAAGIGLFLAHLGLQAAEVITAHPATLVTLDEVASWGPGIMAFGLAVSVVLHHLRVRSALLVGVIASTALAIALEAPIYGGQAWAGGDQPWIQWPVWPTHLFGALDVSGALALGLVDVVFVFLFVDFFDTAATLVALTERAGVADPAGRFPRATAAFRSDALATCAGAVLGTSTTTSYIESAAGVEAGGRTGLTAIGVGLLFLASIFFWPVAAAIPAAATAPVLLMVGASMLQGLQKIRWDEPTTAVPCLLAMVMMPLTYSIAHGIAAGIVSWTVLHLGTRQLERVDPVMVGMTLLLIARYAYLGME